MKINHKRLWRQVHYWLSLAVFIPAGIMFFAGIFLMLKKDVAWIQPPTAIGETANQTPTVSFERIVELSGGYKEAQIKDWSDIDRIDIRPKKGIAKVRAKSGYEIQIDTATGQVLHVAYRRSDVIESIHDGSYFSDSVKRYIFLPTGILLIIMWGSGIYLFLLPRFRKKKSKK